MKKLIYTLAFVLFLQLTLNINYCEAQWQPDVRLTNNTASSYTSANNNAWCIASSGSVVHVVWNDWRDSNNEIYYKRSTDAGVTWEADTRLTNNTSNSQLPSIAVSGSDVYVVWNEYRDGNWEIYYKHSIDAGLNWSSDLRLTINPALSLSPSVAVSGTDVHVVWRDFRDSNHEVYYKRSTNSGTTWSADTRLTNNTAISGDPSVSVSGSLVLVVWTDERDGNPEIYCKSSTDAGGSWGADTRLTNSTGDSYFPSVSISGMFVNVVWQDNRDGNLEIYHKRSQDAGLSWGADMRLTNNTALSHNPSVVVFAAAPVIAVHVVWNDNRDGNDEIYYKNSIDGGNTWSSDTRLTNSTGDSYSSSVAVSGTVVHVVWNDNRDGNFEIYYKRNPTGNVVEINNISTEIPSSYSLSQNYPNPFNPTTVISFQLSVAGQVVLKVYDVMGREVQTLVNESLKPGTYEASFDGSSLNSGVYFYKLITTGFTETKKMLMVK
jgi:hypothetical protein